MFSILFDINLKKVNRTNTMNILKRQKTLIVLALLGIIGGCNKGEQESASSPVNVAVWQAGLPDHTKDPLNYIGTVTAGKAIDLSFQVSGTVTSFPVLEGQYVTKGQLIAAVDETVYQTQYQAQAAQLRLAKENYERISEVFRKGSIAEIRMLEARSQYEQADAAARATYQNVAHTKIHAPVSGYIGAKLLDAGATAGPGVTIAKLLDISSVNVDVPVPEAEIGKYPKGTQATVRIAALQNRALKGIVDQTAAIATAGSPNYTVKIKLPNADRSVKPGMACNVFFSNKLKSTAGQATNNLVIPIEAVQVDEQGKRFVYVADTLANKAARKQVTVGNLSNDGIAITSGLSGNEKIITSGIHKITDSTSINIVNP